MATPPRHDSTRKASRGPGPARSVPVQVSTESEGRRPCARRRWRRRRRVKPAYSGGPGPGPGPGPSGLSLADSGTVTGGTVRAGFLPAGGGPSAPRDFPKLNPLMTARSYGLTTCAAHGRFATRDGHRPAGPAAPEAQ